MLHLARAAVQENLSQSHEFRGPRRSRRSWPHQRSQCVDKVHSHEPREVDPWQNTADVVEEAEKGDAECAISGSGLERAKSDPESLRGLGRRGFWDQSEARSTHNHAVVDARSTNPPSAVLCGGARTAPAARGSTGDDGLCHCDQLGP